MPLPTTRPYISPYLLTPAAAPSPAPRLREFLPRRSGRFEARLRARLRLLPQLNRQTWTGLGLWVVLFSVGIYATQNHSMPTVPASVAAADGPMQPKTAPITALKTAAKLPILSAGPTGQLLPPGTMAPQGAYGNSYSRGQCTWYVAGRRPVPGSWGNARTWLPRAQAAGWATGTTPAIAAIGWTSAGAYGHVVLVEDVDVAKNEVLVSEMNYRGPYQVDKRWVPAGSFKYIY